MTETSWKPAITTNGHLSSQVVYELIDNFRRPLGNMSPDKLFSLVAWHYPADLEFRHPDHVENYLQCAGTAERLSLELRRTNPDGTYEHWVLGLATPTGEASERVPWSDHVLEVHPEEVWTAETAAPVLDQYARTRTIPEGIHRRAIDL